MSYPRLNIFSLYFNCVRVISSKMELIISFSTRNSCTSYFLSDLEQHKNNRAGMKFSTNTRLIFQKSVSDVCSCSNWRKRIEELKKNTVHNTLIVTWISAVTGWHYYRTTVIQTLYLLLSAVTPNSTYDIIAIDL